MTTATRHFIQPKSLRELLAVPIDELGGVDIGRANLLCAEGLPGAEDLDVEEHVHRLDAWAERIRQMTERHLPRFPSMAAQFENSEPKWRLYGIAKILNHECGVSYNEDRIDGEPDWTDSQDLLIHGITGPRRRGTCPSLPVAMVAIGRRLNYPMFLVLTKAHNFSRWDAPNHSQPAWCDRFNVEFHGGMGFYDDDYYFDFPIHWSEAMREQHRRGDPGLPYLKSLTPAAELAQSLCERAVCLEASGRFEEAVNAYHTCHRYHPQWGGYPDFAKRALRSRAESIMRSMGFDPLGLRGWILQAGAQTLNANSIGPLSHSVTIPGSGAIHPGVIAASTSLTIEQLTRDQPLGVTPANLDEILQLILLRTCHGTPAVPTPDLLLPHPREPKVDNYGRLRTEHAAQQAAS